MAKFKTEFENCTVTVNSPAVGKITINTATVNPNHWVNVKEFAFMFEVEAIKERIGCKPLTKLELTDDEDEENNGLIADSYADFTLNELRERFPNIKATSKKAFIEQIEA
jgi:hypothetical protein